MAARARSPRSIIDGLDADVATLALAYDIDAIADKAKLLPKGLAEAAAAELHALHLDHRVPGAQGQSVEDQGLARSGEAGRACDHAESEDLGGARWAYLAAWAYAEKAPGGSAEKAKAFVGQLYKHVPVLDTGARGSTTTFAQRGIGDVLLSWENEAQLALRETGGADKFQVVYPSNSILAEPPVALIDKNVDRHGTRKVVEAYLQFLYSKDAQEIEAKDFYRPRDQAILAAHGSSFPKIPLYSIDDVFGGWAKAQQVHFGDGGVFDQIYKPGQ